MSDISNKTHFRRLRELLIAMCRYENVFADGEEYNFNNIHCYKILGSDLKGKNV